MTAMTILGFEYGVLSFEFAQKADLDVAPRKTQLKTQN
jgi:hypothetical protein